eukprot:TRINITY_DN2422_c0_g1_i5.p1 TRINITY_DN2422_c0_g1~~TRINITY_DN2422_c0_g1_i5.p1  ORF type:complete len:270 (-),score=108.15 TRINITY_DN2422_c0_g1_i5:159-968(-)
MSDQEVEDVPAKSPARSRSAKSPAPKSAKSPAQKSAKSPATKSTKTVTKSKDPASKAGATHPTYSEMVSSTIQAIAARGGCSRQAILKKIKEDFDVGDNEKRVAVNVNMTLKKGIESGRLKMAREKGKGAGSYKLGELPKAEKKPVKRLAADKTKVKKKVATEKAVVKKSATVKSKEKASAKRKSVGALATKKKLKTVTPSKKTAAKKTPSKATKKDGKAASKTVAKKNPSKASKPAKKTPVKAAAKKGSAAKPAKPSDTKKKTPKKTK